MQQWPLPFPRSTYTQQAAIEVEPRETPLSFVFTKLRNTHLISVHSPQTSQVILQESEIEFRIL